MESSSFNSCNSHISKVIPESTDLPLDLITFCMYAKWWMEQLIKRIVQQTDLIIVFYYYYCTLIRFMKFGYFLQLRMSFVNIWYGYLMVWPLDTNSKWKDENFTPIGFININFLDECDALGKIKLSQSI